MEPKSNHIMGETRFTLLARSSEGTRRCSLPSPIPQLNFWKFVAAEQFPMSLKIQKVYIPVESFSVIQSLLITKVWKYLSTHGCTCWVLIISYQVKIIITVHDPKAAAATGSFPAYSPHFGLGQASSTRLRWRYSGWLIPFPYLWLQENKLSMSKNITRWLRVDV